MPDKRSAGIAVFLNRRTFWIMMAVVLSTTNASAYEFKLNPGQKCPRYSTLGPRPFILGLDKIIVAVGVRNRYSQEKLPQFLNEQNFPTYVLNVVKKRFGSCVGDESKIVLAEKSYATDREVSGTLSIQLEGYIAKDKEISSGMVIHYAVFWLHFYRPDDHYKNDGFFMPNDPGVVFIDHPEENVKEKVNGLLDRFLVY